MATTVPACLALITGGIPGWDNTRAAPITTAQRVSAIASILAGTVATKADVLALIATAATAAGCSQKAVYDYMVSPTVSDPVAVYPVGNAFFSKEGMPITAAVNPFYSGPNPGK
jgi:hypothetical protein